MRGIENILRATAIIDPTTAIMGYGAVTTLLVTLPSRQGLLGLEPPVDGP